MPEKTSPKNKVPIKDYPTPNWGDAPVDGVSVVDEYLREYVECNAPGYVPAPIGSSHPNTRDFPNHRLLKEESVSDGINLRHYCNAYRNVDQYNYDIAYSSEENSHPIFSRRYLEFRNTYESLIKETKFTGVYLIEVTGQGSGYNPQVPPTVTMVGGGGAGATALAVVGSGGTVDYVYLTNEGSGYTSVPIVTFSSGAATATARLQLDTGVVYSITVTAGGAGYVSAPTITFAGGGGTGAQAVSQISGGSVVAILVTHYGSGYTSAPTVVFSSGVAAATANIETATCRLIKEDAQNLPEDDPRHSLFLLVTRVYETFPGPYLIEHRYEKYLNVFVTTIKRTVLASTVPPDMTYVTRTPGQIVEYHPFSKHQALQSISYINPNIAFENGGADVTYQGTVPYNFPNEIHDNPVIDVYEAHSTSSSGGTTLDIAFGWRLNVLEGYSGPCEATFTTRYTFDPQNAAFLAALPAITYIKPEAAVINNGFTYAGANLIAQATQFNIPSTLHPELTIDVDTHGSTIVTNLDGPVSIIPATVPTGLPAGTLIYVSIKPTFYDFGLWVYSIISVVVPTPPP